MEAPGLDKGLISQQRSAFKKKRASRREEHGGRLAGRGNASGAYAKSLACLLVLLLSGLWLTPAAAQIPGDGVYDDDPDGILDSYNPASDADYSNMLRIRPVPFGPRFFVYCERDPVFNNPIRDEDGNFVGCVEAEPGMFQYRGVPETWSDGGTDYWGHMYYWGDYSEAMRKRFNPHGDRNPDGTGIDYPGELNVLFQVYEGTVTEGNICTMPEQDAMMAKYDDCEEAWFAEFDGGYFGQPPGYGRAEDAAAMAVYEGCLADAGDDEVEVRACERTRDETVEERLQWFFDRCYGNSACRSALEECEEILEECRDEWEDWAYYETRRFEVPCQAFDSVNWQEASGLLRSDWGRDGDRDRKTYVDEARIVSGGFLSNRAFISEGGFWDFVGLGGKPMFVRTYSQDQANVAGLGLINDQMWLEIFLDEWRSEEGIQWDLYNDAIMEAYPLNPVIGSIYWIDYREGTMQFESFSEPRAFFDLQFPDALRDAGDARGHRAWVDRVYFCEDTFTAEEVTAWYRENNIMPAGVDTPPGCDDPDGEVDLGGNDCIDWDDIQAQIDDTRKLPDTHKD